MDMMFFLPQLGGGGAEMNAVRLAPGLMANGIQPIYVVARGPGTYAEYLPDGVEVITLETGSLNSSTLRLMRARKPLARLLEVRRPEVLCPVMLTPTLAALSAVRRSRYRPTVISSIQNSLDISHGSQASCRSRAELALARRMFRHCDGAIALSRGVAATFERMVPAIGGRIEVVPNVGLPLESQVSETLPSERGGETPYVLVSCGRLAPQKDYPTLLRAVAMLRGRVDVRLDVLGEGKLRESLVQLSRDLEIDDRVRWLGFQRDPYAHMRRADIFVLSSRWEGFGNVIVEAMAMGTPVISTDCPHGPGEIITHGKTGLLVSPADSGAMADAIEMLVRDRTRRASLGAAGQRRAQDFSAERIGKAYADAVVRLTRGAKA